VTYLFVFGNAPKLSLAELSSYLSSHKIKKDAELHTVDGLFLELDSEINLSEIADNLGGTVKVAIVEQEFERLDEPFVDFSTELISQNTSGKKAVFGFSISHSLQKTSLPVAKWNKDIKESLVEKGFSTRFILANGRDGQLSSVVIKKQNVTELILGKHQGGKFFVGRTIWVQDFEEWGRRDYGRPEAQGHIGMLPPKVARMMVNLAGTVPGQTVLDPFCGVGTILMEASVLGAQVCGSDIDKEQVARTKANLEWMKINDCELHTVDARDVGKFFVDKQFDAIVTEPDLGPNDNVGNWRGELKQKLIHLYIDSLTHWKTFLPEGQSVVIALPSLNEDLTIVRAVIDKAGAMGYSFHEEIYPYFRPGATVQRNICKFVRI